MNTLADVNLLLFLLSLILGTLAYAAVGLAVLLALDLDPDIEALTQPIEGLQAWFLLGTWPLTACWLLWHAFRARRRRRRA